jgi:hypothetical protein
LHRGKLRKKKRGGHPDSEEGVGAEEEVHVLAGLFSSALIVVMTNPRIA